MTPPDKLIDLLSRVKQRAEVAAQAELKASLLAKRFHRSAAIAHETALCAADYALRLAERAKFRELLSSDRLDGERFRWYFTHIENSQDLDSLRKWIDGKIVRGS